MSMSTRTSQNKTDLPEEIAVQLREIESKLQTLEAQLTKRG